MIIRSLIALVVLAALAVAFRSTAVPPPTAQQPQQQRTATAKTPEQIARELKDAAAARALAALRDSMKNPASFSLVRALRMKDGAICFRYRATNGFNAMIADGAVFAEKQLITTADHWLFNKHCAGKSGEDITWISSLARLM